MLLYVAASNYIYHIMSSFVTSWEKGCGGKSGKENGGQVGASLSFCCIFE